jgi:glucosyltransferase
MEKISIVVPCYNEFEVLDLFYDEVKKVLDSIENDYELIFVNDGSKDKTFDKMKELRAKDDNIVLISFSRNFGKEAAIYAGLQKSTGDLVALMDADLQDPPALIPEMLAKIAEGYDVVSTYRQDRKGESKIKSVFARGFYRFINKLIDFEIVDGARDYRLMKRYVVDSILDLSEYHRFSKGLMSWVGYDTYLLPFENVNRAAGETKWSFFGLLKYALEGIISFTDFPLKLSTYMGMIISILATIMAVFYSLQKIFLGTAPDGWTTLVVLVLFLGAIQLLALGLIGEYVGRTFTQTKNRPVYIIKEMIGQDNEEE